MSEPPKSAVAVAIPAIVSAEAPHSPTRIYADESGTHEDATWLVIGMLFARDRDRPEKHIVLHEQINPRFGDLDVRTRRNIREVVIEWENWNGKYFGGPFEPDSLKKRKAYKKWAEMLLQPEVCDLSRAEFYLDELKMLHRYDVIPHLQARFTPEGYVGKSPRIAKFQHTKSWKGLCT
jgi:hypothetical protein